MTSPKIVDQTTAQEVADTYAVAPGVYVLGSLSAGVTVFKQQVRAHNLAAALCVMAKSEGGDGALPLESPSKFEVAVIGGGVAGLTLTAAMLSLSEDVQVTLFEKRWDLCPLQQGSDTRWLHPRIYEWPSIGSRAPSASLPVLNWSEGRASDVAAELLNRFADYSDMYGGDPESLPDATPRLQVYLGLSHLSINAQQRSVEWMGRKAMRRGPHFSAGDPFGETKPFKVIVVAAGFGLEVNDLRVSTVANSYWRNDILGQPSLEGGRRVFVVSGYGDGAVVDLCRLTIERFRQDRILEELFGTDIDAIEEYLRDVTHGQGGRIAMNVKTVFDQAQGNMKAILDAAIVKLKSRLRKDIRAVLHAEGKPLERDSKIRKSSSIEKIFDGHSSFLNRTVLYLLYRSGAFTISFEPLDRIKIDQGATDIDIVQRYGTTAMNNLSGLFSDHDFVEAKLDDMKQVDRQSASRLWSLGEFPYVPERSS
ncbi:MAG: hypothetical protein V4701_01355 [Pseudomonadota bacterium]